MDAPELGSILVQAGLISKDQLTRAIKFQKEVGGGKLPIILTKLNIVDEKKLVEFFSKQQRLPIQDLDELILPANLIRRVPESIIKKHEVLPVSFVDDVLTVVTWDPYDMEALQELEMAVECRVSINLARRSQIVKRINDFFERDGLGSLETPKEETETRKRKSKGKEGPDLGVLAQALLPVLLEKKIVTKDELARKAKELGLLK
jgi:type IV pilus assembly protein PilB